MSHPVFTVIASVLLAAAFAAVENRTRRERAQVAARVFLCCLFSVFAGGWLMRLIQS